MMKPTDEQLRDPKWWAGSAPQSATHFDCARGRFFKQVGGVWCQCFQEYATRWKVADIAPTKAHLIKRPTKPAAPEWDGDGLPPVGCECEFMTTEWRKGRVVCYVDGLHDRQGVVQFEDDWQCFNGDEVEAGIVRPIRTKEQRERDELIKIIGGRSILSHSFEIADDILKAGYQKERDK